MDHPFRNKQTRVEIEITNNHTIHTAPEGCNKPAPKHSCHTLNTRKKMMRFLRGFSVAELLYVEVWRYGGRQQDAPKGFM